ncbi:hypothetical protein BDZ91DRAFT_732800 [Kalaharituber pfeilii]|nr:hypothetical protein BDZ91DRAFT_732800 [Kalaharituber pfeilii]
MCKARHGSLSLLTAPQNRVRQACQDCIRYGRNPILTSTNLFHKHTLKQLTGMKDWGIVSRHEDSARYLMKVQERDRTFAPNRMDLFDLGHIYDGHSYKGLCCWMRIPKPVKYNPSRDRMRMHNSSRCMCIQAGYEIPICSECANIGCYFDYNYDSFARQNPGVCECGKLLWDFQGEGGVILPGQGWDPQKHTLDDCYPNLQVERIVGLCAWCGFRVYEQVNKGNFPLNYEAFMTWKSKRLELENTSWKNQSRES